MLEDRKLKQSLYYFVELGFSQIKITWLWSDISNSRETIKKMLYLTKCLSSVSTLKESERPPS